LTELVKVIKMLLEQIKTFAGKYPESKNKILANAVKVQNEIKSLVTVTKELLGNHSSEELRNKVLGRSHPFVIAVSSFYTVCFTAQESDLLKTIQKHTQSAAQGTAAILRGVMQGAISLDDLNTKKQQLLSDVDMAVKLSCLKGSLLMDDAIQQKIQSCSDNIRNCSNEFTQLALESVKNNESQSEPLMAKVKMLVAQFKELTQQLKQTAEEDLANASLKFDKALTKIQELVSAGNKLPLPNTDPIKDLINEVEKWKDIETPKQMISSMLNITTSVSKIVPLLNDKPNEKRQTTIFSTTNSFVLFFMKMKILACLNVLEANEDKLNLLLLTTATLLDLIGSQLLVL